MSSTSPMSPKRLSFYGTGWALFEILFVNTLLKVFTFGIYHPWARARKLSYFYSQTEFFGRRFAFHGTGSEMFLGYIKGLLLLGGFYFLSIYFLIQIDPQDPDTFQLEFIAFPILIVLIAFFIVYPLAIHGSLKYRLAKTSWSGIRMGYRGELSQLFRLFATHFLLCILSIGLYTPWFICKIFRYLSSNIKMGDAEFRFKGSAKTLFLIYLKGIILTPLTIGIYGLWFYKNLFEYFLNGIEIRHQGAEHPIKAEISPWQVLAWHLPNAILLILTLGLAYPWVAVRSAKHFFSYVEISSSFDPDKIVQTEQEYNDALGEDLSDMLDIGFI